MNKYKINIIYNEEKSINDIFIKVLKKSFKKHITEVNQDVLLLDDSLGSLDYQTRLTLVDNSYKTIKKDDII